MSRLKKFLSIMLSAVLILSLIACKENKEDKSDKSDKNENSSWREPPKTNKSEKTVDTDGIFKYDSVDFNDLDSYVIVYPAENDKDLISANILKSYYKSTCKVDLSVVTDKNEERDKEILIGKTNRRESNKKIGESDLEVSVKGNKLVFDGGHDVTVKSAVEKFTRIPYQKGKTFVFKLTTDFKENVLDGYKYVWGDEFEGSDLDFTKWDFEERMSGTGKIKTSYDREVIDVNEGRLKLHAVNYFDPLQKSTRYKVPYSVVTKYKMNYTYGYAEIRARVPFYKGSWPSFWGLNIGGSNESGQQGGVCYDPVISKKKNYMAEIDIFEVFGNKSKIEPNLHKWYNSSNFNYDKKFGVKADNHTTITKKEIWDWKNKEADLNNLSNEYHTYGFEWTDKVMNFFVDGEKYYTVDIDMSFDLDKDMSRFHEPIFLMFNNHVFADDLNWFANVIENHTEMPFCYYIDWFRLYQKPGKGKLYLDTTVKKYEGREVT